MSANRTHPARRPKMSGIRRENRIRKGTRTSGDSELSRLQRLSSPMVSGSAQLRANGGIPGSDLRWLSTWFLPNFGAAIVDFLVAEDSLDASRALPYWKSLMIQVRGKIHYVIAVHNGQLREFLHNLMMFIRHRPFDIADFDTTIAHVLIFVSNGRKITT